MLVEHGGHRPRVDPTAWIAPNATISGNVVIGPGARILYGAVLTAEDLLPLTVGRDCVIMEQAVLRSAARWTLELGEYVSPHAYLSGCSIGSGSFIATGAMVSNGASLGTSCVVALGGKVHVETNLCLAHERGVVAGRDVVKIVRQQCGSTAGRARE